MSIPVIEGPVETTPRWKPSVEIFVSTNRGLRKIEEPRSKGSVADQAQAWLADIAFGGRPQYWLVDVSAKDHPELVFELAGSDGVMDFRITLHFQVRVRNARLVLEQNVADLDGYFTSYLRSRIADMAKRRDIAEAHLLRRDIDQEFGFEFFDSMVEAKHLTAQVRPANPEVIADLQRAGQVAAKEKAIAADTAIKRAQLKHAATLTEGMTIHEFAHAVIMSNSPELLEAYNNLRASNADEGRRNLEVLKWLVQERVVEAHDIQKHIGLDDRSIERLVRSATGSTGDQPGLPKKP